MKRLLIGLAGLTLVFSTMGAVSAQGSGGFESRAAFIKELDVQLGIAPVYPTSPDFTDVPSSSPYYGYIEAAFQRGFISGLSPGRFGPSQPLTRAQAAKILVEAYGAGSAAQNITSTKFSDNARIPAALVGFVGEAAALGLMEGVTKTTFAPLDDLTQSQMVDLIQHLLTAKANSAQSALELVPPSSTSFSEDNAGTGLTYGIRAVDSHGNAIPLPASYAKSGLVVTVRDSAGQIAQTIKVDGHYQGTAGYDDTGAASGSFTLTDDQSAADAGTYTLQVSDPHGVFASTAKATFTQTTGVMNAVTATDPAMLYSSVIHTAIDLENGIAPASNPSRSVTAQLTDAFGNPIARAGIPIYFDASDGCSDYTPTLSSAQGGVLTQGSYNGRSGPVLQLVSNAQGQATATVTGDPVPSYYCLDLWSPDTPDTNGASTNHGNTEVGFTVVKTLATQLQMQFTDGSPSSPDYQSPSGAVAGDHVGVTLTALDQNNNTSQGQDVIQVSFSSPNAFAYSGPTGSSWPSWLTINADGSWDVQLDSAGTRVIPSSYFTVGASGNITATLTDISLATPVSGTGALKVQAGPPIGFGFRDSRGVDTFSGYAVTANSPLALDLSPIDNESDWTVADANYIVNFYYPTGQFRLTPQGSGINQMTVPAGSSGVALYFVSPNNLTTYTMGWNAWVSYPSGSSLSLQPGQSITFTGDDWQGASPATPIWSFVGVHAGTVAGAADGGLMDTYTAPASGQGTDQIEYTDPAGDTLDFSVSY